MDDICDKLSKCVFENLHKNDIKYKLLSIFFCFVSFKFQSSKRSDMFYVPIEWMSNVNRETLKNYVSKEESAEID